VTVCVKLMLYCCICCDVYITVMQVKKEDKKLKTYGLK
jgi:hypothetical protein